MDKLEKLKTFEEKESEREISVVEDAYLQMESLARGVINVLIQNTNSGVFNMEKKYSDILKGMIRTYKADYQNIAKKVMLDRVKTTLESLEKKEGSDGA